MSIAKVSFIYKDIIHVGKIDKNQQILSEGVIYINANQWCNSIRVNLEESVLLGVGNIIPCFFYEVKRIISCAAGNCSISPIYDMPNSTNLFITAKFIKVAWAKDCKKKLKENKIFGPSLHLRIKNYL